MQRWPGWWQALGGPPRPPTRLPTSWLLGLLLFPCALQLRGGRLLVTHTGPPIIVSLAKKAVSFGCSISYRLTPEFRDFSIRYFHVNLQGQPSPEKDVCSLPSLGALNKTHILDCLVTPQLPDASATGTYYCAVHWQHLNVTGGGTFILVRDAGYREPPVGPKQQLLFGFTGLLAFLSVLGTALLIWKKKGMQLPGKHPAQKCPEPRATSHPEHPPAESVYTALQRRQTEVYAYIESEEGASPTAQSPPAQEEPPRSEDEGEFNLVYENL
ncbi:NFAT activation molecule 1 isoform X1 [Choloepus didactylus]|uniref:NFAT activation molecule 1 isoform X1 n=1 Tax=Choloepus didactylus TaxID=27675 RepID=UPI0018A057FA|nr:NFAT activation molecule 1 isoform X1 [Choloepus didactylus]